MMDLMSLVKKSRSIRRFSEDGAPDEKTLLSLIEYTRFCPSARNRQPLRYIAVTDPDEVNLVFSCIGWALDLDGWAGPAPKERPPAYIIVLAGEDAVPDPCYDAGIAAQTIMLAAAERGLSGCIFGTVERVRLARLLAVPEGYRIHLVLALGLPKEMVAIESLPAGGDTRYWRDEEGVHHVPKRSLEELLVKRG